MGIGLFDEVRALRLVNGKKWISDEETIRDIEFNEAQGAFCQALCGWHDTKEPNAMEKMTEADLQLLNAFMHGTDNPVLRKAWSAYRYRLFFRHRRKR